MGGEAASTGAPSRPTYRHRGIGFDYAFADVVGENLVSCAAVGRYSSRRSVRAIEAVNRAD